MLQMLTTTHTGQCPATDNVRLDGFDLLPDGCNNKQPDAGACCNQCRSNLACVAWTYNRNGSLPCTRTGDLHAPMTPSC